MYLRLNPTFKVEGIVVVLHPLEMVSVANEYLGPRPKVNYRHFQRPLASSGGRQADALNHMRLAAWS